MQVQQQEQVQQQQLQQQLQQQQQQQQQHYAMQQQQQQQQQQQAAAIQEHAMQIGLPQIAPAELAHAIRHFPTVVAPPPWRGNNGPQPSAPTSSQWDMRPGPRTWSSDRLLMGMPSIPEGEPHGEHPDEHQDCNTARWGTEGRRPDGELGAPNSTSDDVVMAGRVADLTNYNEQDTSQTLQRRHTGVIAGWLADIAKVTQGDDHAAAQMLAARELEMQKIQKAAEEAAVYAKAEMERKYQEAAARWAKLEMEQEAWDEQDWAEMEELESRAEANWDEQMEAETWGEQDAQVQAEMAKAEATLASADQWQVDEADVNAEYAGYEATVDEEGCWDGDRTSNMMAQIVGPADAYEDEEGGIRRILFS